MKVHDHHGGVIVAMGVLGRLLNQGPASDAIIFNTVLTDCTVRAAGVSDVFHVLDRMVHQGLQTSLSTLSVMPKALAKSGA